LDYNWLGFTGVVMFVLVLMAGVHSSRLPPTIKWLFCVALLLRIVGAFLRYGVLYYAYDGIGDAVGYYRQGLAYADQFWNFDFSAFTDSSQWRGGKWWGTQFVYFPSGIVLSVIGATMLGEFLMFSLLSFLGLIGFAVAFRRDMPQVPLIDYGRWLFLFPSLWFWPSSVGKDALILMGLGIAIAGYVGDRERIRWGLLSLGLFFVLAVRPQLAAVAVASMLVAQWVSTVKEWTPAKIFQSLALACGGLGVLWLSLRYLGVSGFDAEGIEAYLEANMGRGIEGGSAIESITPGLSNIPIALINILFRPFPWEARSLTLLAGSLEIWGFWLAVWIWRRNIAQALRSWHSSRLLRVAVPFILLYSVLLGMLISNMGIIARQRIFLFPFVFAFLAAVPASRAVASIHRRPPLWSGGGPSGWRGERDPMTAGRGLR